MPDPEHYTVGWICAISTEHTAARQFLDSEHGRPDYVSHSDSNDYTLGEIAGHNVVIAVLPEGEYGLSSAAGVAGDMINSFPNITIGLMVGIGGGAPSTEHDIRLGDVVISSPRDGTGGVYQYDYGKTIQGRSFQQTGFLNQPPTQVRTAVSGLKSSFESDGNEMGAAINAVLGRKPHLQRKYGRPAQDSDRLYKPTVVHPHNRKGSCIDLCGTQSLDVEERFHRPEEDSIVIHYGVVASANELMKDAIIRDTLAREKGILCFEMEAAGLMNRFPCLVVRGICDYSDSHKNKVWQGYAAMAAAAYARRLLERMVPTRVASEEKISKVLACVSQDNTSVQTIVQNTHDSSNDHRSLHQEHNSGNATAGGHATTNYGGIHFTGNPALINCNFDFSMARVDAPQEFQTLGSLLNPMRRKEAEVGGVHATARKLGAIFDSILPSVPRLVQAYGERASEIAKHASSLIKEDLGIFEGQVGVDGTSIWAAATSGQSAIKVHLLACMLASMWDAPMAISIWVELLHARKEDVDERYNRTGSTDLATYLATRQEVSREQLSKWDNSARAWLRIADRSMESRQRQMVATVGSLQRHVNSKPDLYSNVLDVWIHSLRDMERLMQGSPLHMQAGGLLLALVAWHLYPRLNILNTTIAQSTYQDPQIDPLFPESAILTVGLELGSRSSGEGLFWCLPLAHLRYYGDPISREARIGAEGSRLSLREFHQAILGCLIGSWNVNDGDITTTAKWIVAVAETFDLALEQTGQPSDQVFHNSWLSIIKTAAYDFLTSDGVRKQTNIRLVNLGRRQKAFLGKANKPFFGLSETNHFLALQKGQENKIEALRLLSSRSNINPEDVVIRYISEDTKKEEFATAIPRLRGPVKRTSGNSEKHSSGHTRWIHLEPTLELEAEQERVSGTDSYMPQMGDDLVAELPCPTGPIVLPPDFIRQAITKASKSYALQKARYEFLGESVAQTELAPISSVLKRGCMRVVEMNIEAGDRLDNYEHWFGPTKHFDSWLGNIYEAAVFVRITHPDPSPPQVLLPDMLELFSRQRVDHAAFLQVFRDSLQSLNKDHIRSLQCIATMTRSYSIASRASIDVRVLQMCLPRMKWTLGDDKVTINNSFQPPSAIDRTLAKVTAPSLNRGDSQHLPIVLDDLSTDGSNGDPHVDFETGTMSDSTDCSANDPTSGPHVQSVEPSDYFESALEVPLAHEPVTLPPLPVPELMVGLEGMLNPFMLDRDHAFSCLLMFESGKHDIRPTQLNHVMAISSGDSLFVAASLLQDPYKIPADAEIRHVVGNIGRAGIALLVPPLEPMIMGVGINTWHIQNYDDWDGSLRDSFQDTSLHLLFTGASLPVDTDQTGMHDTELYILEAVISVHGKGKWYADLDILSSLQPSSKLLRMDTLTSNNGMRGGQRRLPLSSGAHCSQGHLKAYDPGSWKLKTIENWIELLEECASDTVVLATGNWQARLAASAVSLAKGRKVIVIGENDCWRCIQDRAALYFPSASLVTIIA